MEASAGRILLVEDEKKLAESVRRALAAEGYMVRVAHDGEEGFFLLHSERFDLAVLDIMLPGRDGLQILGALRERGLRLPVLLLTARDAVQDRVAGLDAGADDYLVKPFAFPELVARVRVLLRRQPEVAETRSVLGGLQLDAAAHTASRDGTRLELTPREFSLLEYLLLHKERVVSREMLARDVWKETSRYTPLDNVIDVHMARLRQKVDGPHERKLLHTVRGVGFVLREEP